MQCNSAAFDLCCRRLVEGLFRTRATNQKRAFSDLCFYFFRGRTTMGERDFSDIWLLFTDCFVFHLYRGLGEDGQGRRGEGRGTFYVLNSGATSLISPRL